MRSKEYISIREARRRVGMEYYKPTPNKIKLGILISFVIVCIITPFTNWLIGVVGFVINKYNPLWVYR